MAAAEQKMTQAINRIKSTLPDGVDPQVVTGSFDDLPRDGRCVRDYWF